MSDGLNMLGKKAIALPYEQYFGEMGISEEQKKKRIELAKQLEELFIILFVLMRNSENIEEFDTETTEDRFFDALKKVGINLTKKVKTLVIERVEHIVDVTKRHMEDPWYLSDDRAKANAEEESGTFWNTIEFDDAMESGYTKKTWHTMLDDLVRGSHYEVEGDTIPIHEYFEVGDSLMMYPRDPNGEEEEIANCRCWLTYS